MKKVLLGFALLSTVAMAYENLEFKFGVDLSQKTTVLKNKDGLDRNKNHNSGTLRREWLLENTENVTDNFKFGTGIGYQYHGITKESDQINSQTFRVKMRSYPVYFVGKYTIPLETEYKLYLFANMGYSFNHGKQEETVNNMLIKNRYRNGLYYAAGIGLDNGYYSIELAYKVNNGKMKTTLEQRSRSKEEHSSRFNYGRIVLGFGVKIKEFI